MKTRTKAILLTMVLPPLFMELMVGNLPGFAFFNPVILIILLFGYSLPVLAIREISARWKLGLGGLFALGLAYGIFNEGLGAKTLLLSRGIPTPSFDNYGYMLGISFPWSAYIIVTHALLSVMIPIIMVRYLYPEIAGENWLGKKTTAVIAVISVFFGCGIFLSSVPHEVPPIYLAVFLISMAILFVLAKLLPKSEGLPASPCGMKPLFLGILSMLVYSLGLDMISNMKLPVAVFFLLWLAILAAFGTVMKIKHWMSMPAAVLFGLGLSMTFSITGTINSVILKSHPEGLVIGLCFMAIFIWAAVKIKGLNTQQLHPY